MKKHKRRYTIIHCASYKGGEPGIARKDEVCYNEFEAISKALKWNGELAKGHYLVFSECLNCQGFYYVKSQSGVPSPCPDCNGTGHRPARVVHHDVFLQTKEGKAYARGPQAAPRKRHSRQG